MQEYDNEHFFEEYAKMGRSRQGLSGAGEWHQLKLLFPDLKGKSVLDLGCGYGWHCKYSIQQGAGEVLGIDSSMRMLEEAKKRNGDEKITYRVCGVEEYEYPENRWDFVISNLVLHYIENLDEVRDSVEITPVLTTSDDAYSKIDIENMDSYEKEDKDIDGPFNVGVYVTEEVEENLTEIIYFSSSSLLNDSVDQMVSGSDMQLVLNAVSTLCKSDDSSSVSVPSKSLQMDYLTLTAFDASFWMMVTIILIPGACIVIGLVVWLKRRKK